MLYRPPFKATTAVLGRGPMLLIVIGAAIFVLLVRKRRAAPAAADKLTDAERAQLEALLEDAPQPPGSEKAKPAKRSKR